MNSDQILALTQAQWGTAQFQDNWETQDWYYFDEVGYPTGAAGPSTFRYFTVPAGQNDPALAVLKTAEQTNLTTPNQIGGNECFIATGIRAFLHNSAKARQLGTGVAADASFSARQLAFARFLDVLGTQGVLTWTIMQKAWLRQDKPWTRFAAGFGLGELMPPAIGTGAGAAINGGANAYTGSSPYDVYCAGDAFSLAQPVFLAPNTTFEITISQPLTGASFPANQNLYGAGSDQPATLWTGIILDGFKVRPRQ